jgi:hypothetical protein
MRILSYNGAQVFCAAFQGTSKRLGMREFFKGRLKNARVINEGSPLYLEYCDNLLREADRSLLFGISCFRRSLDLLAGAGSVWALVGLYYSSWFGARAFLAMHGAWVESSGRIEVRQEGTGRQVFGISRKSSWRTHQDFWTSYYDGLRPYQQLINPQHSSAVLPINNEKHWQIKLRNRVNYDTNEALVLAGMFEKTFDERSFPTTLPGELGTQFAVSRSTLLLAAEEATRLSLVTDAFDPAFATRREALTRLVFEKTAPDLGQHAERSHLEC